MTCRTKRFLPSWWLLACVVSAFVFSCGGPSFEAVSSSPESATTSSAEGREPDSGELEAASSPADGKVDVQRAIAFDGGNDAFTAGLEAVSPICNTSEEFQRECVLWYKRELSDAGTCWDRCGTCEGIGAVCIRKAE